MAADSTFAYNNYHDSNFNQYINILTNIFTIAEVGSAPSTTAVDKSDLKSKKRTFIPDYTVRVTTNLHYLMLKYSAYKAAILATGIERSNADPTQAHSNYWQEEIDKVSTV